MSTYIWDKIYWNRNIEAHHVDHLQNDRALGAGNLLDLREYHHDSLGDKLDRDEITGTTENARRVVELARHADLPVHAGCPRPLRRPPIRGAARSIGRELSHSPGGRGWCYRPGGERV